MSPRKPGTKSPPAVPALADGDEIGRRIVEAAAAAIVERGFAGASTDEIARAAKTSKRAIYERYPDRDSLFESVMAYLCSQAGERPDEDAAGTSLDGYLALWGYAVLLRFSKPRARRVLAAAIGASSTFPAALEIFWECGPGVAVRAIAGRLKDEKRSGTLPKSKPEADARHFITECCGPLVLDQLFEPAAAPTDAELRRHVDDTVKRLVAAWRER